MGKRTNDNGIYWRWLDDCSAQIIRMHWLRTKTVQGASRSLEISPDQLRRIIRKLQARGLLADLPADARTLDGAAVEDDDKDEDDDAVDTGDEVETTEPGAADGGSNG